MSKEMPMRIIARIHNDFFLKILGFHGKAGLLIP